MPNIVDFELYQTIVVHCAVEKTHWKCRAQDVVTWNQGMGDVWKYWLKGNISSKQEEERCLSPSVQ